MKDVQESDAAEKRCRNIGTTLFGKTVSGNIVRGSPRTNVSTYDTLPAAAAATATKAAASTRKAASGKSTTTKTTTGRHAPQVPSGSG